MSHLKSTRQPRKEKHHEQRNSYTHKKKTMERIHFLFVNALSSHAFLHIFRFNRNRFIASLLLFLWTMSVLPFSSEERAKCFYSERAVYWISIAYRICLAVDETVTWRSGKKAFNSWQHMKKVAYLKHASNINWQHISCIRCFVFIVAYA